MNIYIVANGKITLNLLKNIKKNSYIIGVDRGALILIIHNIIPDMAIGDFDSVKKDEFQIIKKRVKNIVKFDSRKDKTDLELAVEYSLKKKPDELDILGATGTRIDPFSRHLF
ncbi:protein containing Thiamin pyrophosphokinase, catalytic region domain [sediment metagenome]|uniref:Protein containing Thiamin pyrophosphokinase, catalytic region domain n=1 Tax=sediment metagenome TaxID=749907 RepID=D9PKS1_9ZZZZ